MDGKTDERTDGRTDGRKIGRLYHTLLKQVRQKSVEHNLDKICSLSGHGNNNWKVSSKSLENCRRSCGVEIFDGRTDEPVTIVPFDYRRGQKSIHLQLGWKREFSSRFNAKPSIKLTALQRLSAPEPSHSYHSTMMPLSLERNK